MAPTLERKLQLGLMIPIISSGKCRPWHFAPRKSEKRGFRFPSFSITCRDLKWRQIPVPRGHLDFLRRP
jgi:hypothetical protein